MAAGALSPFTFFIPSSDPVVPCATRTKSSAESSGKNRRLLVDEHHAPTDDDPFASTSTCSKGGKGGIRLWFSDDHCIPQHLVFLVGIGATIWVYGIIYLLHFL